MTNEEARAYFIDCNERIISVAKDENIYNYKTQQVEDVFMRRTFEANELAIKALEQEPHETVTEFADRCKECGAHYGRLLNQKWISVSERLPDNNVRVLCCGTSKSISGGYTRFVGCCNNGFWFVQTNAETVSFPGQYEVTAWMPLPEPYKAEGSGEE